MAGHKGGQRGNANAARPFAAALRNAIAHSGTDRAALLAIANTLLEKAMAGDLNAIREVADRLDGKSVQATEMTITDNRAAREIPDDELAYIATGSGARAAGEAVGAQEPAGLH
jgi:hypothetical protein